MSKIIGKVSLYVFIILSSLIFALPLICLLRSSFMEKGQIFILPQEGIPKPFRWQNYKEALTVYPFGGMFNIFLLRQFFLNGPLL